MPDKQIKVISAIYENNIAAVKVGNEVSSWLCIRSGVKQGCVLFPLIRIILIYFVLRSTGKAMGDHGIKWRGLDFDFVDYLSNLEESVSEMNELSELLRVWSARIGWKKFMLRGLSHLD